MRWKAAVALGIATLLLVVVIAAEMAARPIAARVTAEAVEQYGGAERVEVVSLARPAVFDVVRGRLRDVQVQLGGVMVGELRVDEIRLIVAHVDGLFSTARIAAPVDVTAVVTEGDVTAWMAQRAPGFLRPTLRIADGEVVVSDERVPFDLRLAVELHDGEIRLTPGDGDRRLWDVLDISFDIAFVEMFDVRSLVLADGQATVVGRAHPVVDADDEMARR